MSSAERANDWAVWANELTNKQVTWSRCLDVLTHCAIGRSIRLWGGRWRAARGLVCLVSRWTQLTRRPSLKRLFVIQSGVTQVNSPGFVMWPLKTLKSQRRFWILTLIWNVAFIYTKFEIAIPDCSNAFHLLWTVLPRFRMSKKENQCWVFDVLLVNLYML